MASIAFVAASFVVCTVCVMVGFILGRYSTENRVFFDQINNAIDHEALDPVTALEYLDQGRSMDLITSDQFKFLRHKVKASVHTNN